MAAVCPSSLLTLESWGHGRPGRRPDGAAAGSVQRAGHVAPRRRVSSPNTRRPEGQNLDQPCVMRIAGMKRNWA